MGVTRLDELREALAAGYDYPLQEGAAANANVVRYDGDDIVGVALVPSYHRRKLIVAAVNALPALLDVAEAAQRVCDDAHPANEAKTLDDVDSGLIRVLRAKLAKVDAAKRAT